MFSARPTVRAQKALGTTGPEYGLSIQDTEYPDDWGVMRAFMGTTETAAEVPIEILREWALVASKHYDVGLLGRVLTM